MTGRHVHGILAPPRLSRNNKLYLPEALKLGDGMRVPWYIGHEDFEIDARTGQPTGRMLEIPPRGQATLIWDEEFQRLEYDGYVWDDKAVNLIETGETPFVSLAANPTWWDNYRGHQVPFGLKFFSVSQVKNPGIPETTLTMEMKQVLEQFDMATWVEGSLSNRGWILLEGAAPTIGPKGRLVEHDFDDAIAALKAADAIADKAHGEMGAGPPMGPVSEPMHPDFQKMKSAMQQQYGKKADAVYYATLNKRKLDDTKPMPEGMMCPHSMPMGECPMCQVGAGMGQPAQPGQPSFSATPAAPATPGAGGNQQPAPSGLMQGTDSYPFSAPPRGYATPAQMSEDANKSKASSVSSEMAQAAQQDKVIKESSVGGPSGVAGDGLADTLQAPSSRKFAAQVTAPEKNIGMPRTTFEKKLQAKINAGTATKADMKVWEALTKVREEEEEEEDGAGSSLLIPQKSTAVPREGSDDILGTDQPSKAVPGSHPNEPGNASPVGGDVEEEDYGYTKESLEQLFSWSTLNKNEKKVIGEILLSGKYPEHGSLAERTVQKLRESGVLKERSIASQRESRGATGKDVVPSGQPNLIADEFGFGDQYQFEPAIVEMGDLISSWNMKNKFKQGLEYLYPTGSGYAFDLPMLRVPKVNKHKAGERSSNFNIALESYHERANNVLLEAVSAASTGAAIGIDELAPALVIPNQYAGFARDAVYVRPLPQGTNKSRISEITTPQMGNLTENVQPSIVDPTLSTIDVPTYFRGALHQTSFRAERQIIGPYLDGLIMADRVSVLYDEDVMVFGTPNLVVSAALSATGAAGGLENDTNIPAGNKWQAEGYSTAPTAWTVDSGIETTDLMSAQAISVLQKTIITKGYAPENYVLFMHPSPYADLLNDTGITRYLQLGAATGDARDALIAQGVIPDLFGFEIRRCTTVPQTLTGGSGSIPTFHAWAVKKGMTCIMSVSHDIMIETYRDVRSYATFVSVHYDLGVAVAHPNSALLLVSA